MVLQRLLALLAPPVVIGLQVHDAGRDESELEGRKYVTGDAVLTLNDPEARSPSDHIIYHIRTVGEQTLVGLPNDWWDNGKDELLKREDAMFLATGDFEKIGPQDDPCDDLRLRSVTIQGQRLQKQIKDDSEAYGGSATQTKTKQLKRLKFFVDEGEHPFDASIFKLNSSIGVEIQLEDTSLPEKPRETITLSMKTLDNLTAFNTYIPFCTMKRPLGEIKLPNKKKFRQSTRFMEVTCELTDLEDGNKPLHEFGVNFYTSYGGFVNSDQGGHLPDNPSTGIWTKRTDNIPAPGKCAENSPECDSEVKLDLNETYPSLTTDVLGHNYPQIDWYTNNVWFWAGNVGKDLDGLLGPQGNAARDFADQLPPVGCYKPDVSAGRQHLPHGVNNPNGPNVNANAAATYDPKNPFHSPYGPHNPYGPNHDPNNPIPDSHGARHGPKHPRRWK